MLASVLATVGLTVWLTHEREPTYNGKTLSEWVEGYYKASWDPLTRRPTRQDHEAAEAIRAFGTNALPRLLEWTAFDLDFSSPRGAIAVRLYDSWLGTHNRSIARWINCEREYARARDAAVAFGALGTNAIPAIPELERRARQNYRSAYTAIDALGHIGEAAMPTLLAWLANTSGPHRVEVIELFRSHPRLATKNTVAMAQLTSCLDDRDENVRIAATNALMEIAPEVLTNAPTR